MATGLPAVSVSRKIPDWLPRVAPPAIVLLAVLLCLLSNSERLYSPGGYLDEYNYVAFFHNYADATFWPDAYKLARLSWILPGYLCYGCFPPRLAGLVLHVGFTLLGLTACYLAVARLFNRTTAVLATVALAFFSPFYGSGGWDYHNTAAGPYYLLTFWLLTVAATRSERRARWFFVTGCALALTLHANFTMINLVPVLLLHGYVLRRLHGQTTIVGPVLLTLLGTLSVTLLLGAINAAMGREFLFFMVLARMACAYLTNPSKQANYFHPLSTGWYQTADYLVLPAALLLGSIVTLVLSRWVFRKPRSLRQTTALSLQVQYLFVGAVWVYWQLSGQTALDWSYFAYPVYVPAFLAFAGLVYLSGVANHPRGAVGAAVGASLLWYVALKVGPSAADLIQSFSSARLPVLAAFPILVPLGLAGVAVLLLAVRPPVAVSVLVALPLLALANERDLGLLHTWPGGNRATQHLAIVQAFQAMKRHDRHLTRSKVWFDSQEQFTLPDRSVIPLASTGHALAQMAAGYLADPFPQTPAPRDLPADPLAEVISGELTVVLVTNRSEYVDEVAQRLRELHAEIRRSTAEVVSVNHYTFRLFFLDVSPAPASEPPHPAPPAPDRHGSTCLYEAGPVEMQQLGMVLYEATGAVKKADPEEMRAALSRQAAGIYFQPGTAQDHLATRFIDLPPHREGNRRCLRLTFVYETVKPSVHCSVAVQQGGCRHVGYVNLTGTRGQRIEKSQEIVVPESARQVRLVFNPVDVQPSYLPDGLRIEVRYANEAGWALFKAHPALLAAVLAILIVALGYYLLVAPARAAGRAEDRQYIAACVISASGARAPLLAEASAIPLVRSPDPLPGRGSPTR